MRAQFYYQGVSSEIALTIKDYLNARRLALPGDAISSTRAVGDTVQSVLADRLDHLLGSWCKEYSANFARRAMADMTFTDKQ